MARTDKFRHDHNRLLALAKELQAELDPAALAKDGAAARSCLGKLMGKLVVHLAAEDKVLYPELASSRDSAVAALARRFSKEMASTTPQIVAYNNRWHTPSVIKSDPSRFIAETNQVIKILADRINRENLELYAAADAIEARSA